MTFAQRLDAFLDDVKANYGISIGRDDGRTPVWQQQMHLCHMLLFNAYASTQPAHIEPGHRTIAWSHFSDPRVGWQLVRFGDILRTAKDVAPKKNGAAWQAGFEPDKERTLLRALFLLKDEGIGKGGAAMVSSGLAPCGEPCRCGAGRSKHLSGMAADLDTVALHLLGDKLRPKGVTLDAYLLSFGLHRPLLNHPTSPEAWHVEAKGKGAASVSTRATPS